MSSTENPSQLAELDKLIQEILLSDKVSEQEKTRLLQEALAILSEES